MLDYEFPDALTLRQTRLAVPANPPLACARLTKHVRHLSSLFPQTRHRP